MRRALHRIACLALLGVLSGAPAVAVICAELCPPRADQMQNGHDTPPCHGQRGSGSALTTQQMPDCGDHGAASLGALASLITSRGSDLAVMHPVEASPSDRAAGPPSLEPVIARRDRQAPPRRSALASFVLRI